MNSYQMQGQVTIKCGGGCDEEITVDITDWTPIEELEDAANDAAGNEGWVNGQCEKCYLVDYNEMRGDARREEANCE